MLVVSAQNEQTHWEKVKCHIDPYSYRFLLGLCFVRCMRIYDVYLFISWTKSYQRFLNTICPYYNYIVIFCKVGTNHSRTYTDLRTQIETTLVSREFKYNHIVCVCVCAYVCVLPLCRFVTSDLIKHNKITIKQNDKVHTKTNKDHHCRQVKDDHV